MLNVDQSSLNPDQHNVTNNTQHNVTNNTPSTALNMPLPTALEWSVMENVERQQRWLGLDRAGRFEVMRRLRVAHDAARIAVAAVALEVGGALEEPDETDLNGLD